MFGSRFRAALRLDWFGWPVLWVPSGAGVQAASDDRTAMDLGETDIESASGNSRHAAPGSPIRNDLGKLPREGLPDHWKKNFDG